MRSMKAKVKSPRRPKLRPDQRIYETLEALSFVSAAGL
jgi:hypothetical protein